MSRCWLFVFWLFPRFLWQIIFCWLSRFCFPFLSLSRAFVALIVSTCVWLLSPVPHSPPVSHPQSVHCFHVLFWFFGSSAVLPLWSRGAFTPKKSSTYPGYRSLIWIFFSSLAVRLNGHTKLDKSTRSTVWKQSSCLRPISSVCGMCSVNMYAL